VKLTGMAGDGSVICGNRSGWVYRPSFCPRADLYLIMLLFCHAFAAKLAVRRRRLSSTNIMQCNFARIFFLGNKSELHVNPTDTSTDTSSGQSTVSPEAWRDRYTSQRSAASPAEAPESQSRLSSSQYYMYVSRRCAVCFRNQPPVYTTSIKMSTFVCNKSKMNLFNFWATVCKTVRPVLSVRCLSVWLSVCL